MSTDNTNSGDGGNTTVDPMEKHFQIAGAVDETTSSTEQTTGTEGGTGETDKTGEASATAKADSTSSNGNGSTQQQPNAQTAKDTKQAAGPKDLTLEDGTVVKGGAERRFYDQLQIERTRSQHLNSQVQTLTERSTQLQQQNQQLLQQVQQNFGLSAADAPNASKLFNDLRRDPVETLRKLLAEAAAQGYDLKAVGVGLDTEAMRRMIASQVAPLTNQLQQQGPSEEEIEAEALQESQAFFAQFPDAKLHDPVLGELLQKNPSLSLADAYFELRSAFARRGLDWSRPLHEQVSSNATAQTQQQTQQQQPTHAMPNGRTPSIVVPATNVAPMHESTDTGDIIKSAMREVGLNIQ